GHGIPEALEAILIGRSRMDAKVAVLKPLSSAIAIGTGGPFGAEGPIIVTGGAFGSLLGQTFHLSPVERKTLLVAGAAGGMTAIFATPVAAVLLALELMLFEWKPRSFIPVACAAAVAGVLRIPLFGPGPLFPVPPHATPTWTPAAALGLGLAAGPVATGITALLYGCEDLFARLPIHWVWWGAARRAPDPRDVVARDGRSGGGARRVARPARARRRLRRDPRAPGRPARRDDAPRAVAREGADLGGRPRLGDLRRTGGPPPADGERARLARRPGHARARRRALGDARDGRPHGRHNADPDHGDRVRRR